MKGPRCCPGPFVFMYYPTEFSLDKCSFYSLCGSKPLKWFSSYKRFRLGPYRLSLCKECENDEIFEGLRKFYREFDIDEVVMIIALEK